MMRVPEGADRQAVERYMRAHKIKEMMEGMLAGAEFPCRVFTVQNTSDSRQMRRCSLRVS